MNFNSWETFAAKHSLQKQPCDVKICLAFAGSMNWLWTNNMDLMVFFKELIESTKDTKEVPTLHDDLQATSSPSRKPSS